MKNKYNDVLSRLIRYRVFLSNDISLSFFLDEFDKGISIRIIAKKMNIPVEVVRADMCKIYKLSNILYFVEDETLEEISETGDNIDASSQPSISAKNNILDNILNEKYNDRQLENLFVSGELDDFPLALNDTIINESYLFSLTNYDLNAIKALAYENSNTVFLPPYEIKYSYKLNDYLSYGDFFSIADNNIVFNKDIFEYLKTINSAISNNNFIEIIYENAKGETEAYILDPLFISYDAENNDYALLSVIDEKTAIHKLNTIKDIKIIKKEKEPETAESTNKKYKTHILEIAPNVWGNSFFEEPITVKVVFFNETGVFERVKCDLTQRVNGRLYEKNGLLIYEDTVFGKNAFINWVYSYGSSAVVVEPEDLKTEIIESLKLRKDLYTR